MLIPLLGGVLGGALGAAIWAAIAHFLHVEIGWIAWGVGLLVGVGVKLAASDRQLTPAFGVAAALIAVLSVAAGKYIAVGMAVDQAIREVASGDPAIDEEIAISCVADQVVAEYAEEGRSVRWPGGREPQNPIAQADYPSDVWAEAVDRWGQSTPQERAEIQNFLRDNFQANVAASRAQIQQAGFRESFGALDILFLALAVATAYKIAGGATTEPQN